MQSRIQIPDAACPETGPDSRPRLLVAYEDVGAAKRAMLALRRAFFNAGEPVDFQPLLWSFDRLMHLDCRCEARKDAVEADIIVIAASSLKPFASPILEWFVESVSAKQGQNAAVVALIDSSGDYEIAASRLEVLRSAVAKAGLDFFLQEDSADQLGRTDPPPIHSLAAPDRFSGLNE